MDIYIAKLNKSAAIGKNGGVLVAELPSGCGLFLVKTVGTIGDWNNRAEYKELCERAANKLGWVKRRSKYIKKSK